MSGRAVGEEATGRGTPAPGSLGRRYETAAVAFLQARGLRVLARNVVAGGVELDVVAQAADGTVVFVEIRARADGRRGRPEETVGRDKRRRVVRGAAAYLVEAGLWDRVPVRFDVVALEGPCPPPGVQPAFSPAGDGETFVAPAEAGAELVLRWFPGAFDGA